MGRLYRVNHLCGKRRDGSYVGMGELAESGEMKSAMDMDEVGGVCRSRMGLLFLLDA